jgi:apolipoprotein N-acyltransferase
VTVAHPLICVGQWFPATRWFGLLLPLLMILLYRWLGPGYTAAVLLASVVVTHVRWTPPTADPQVATVNTYFGGSAFVPRSSSVLYQQERLIEAEALSHPDSVVLFPETAVPAWSQSSDYHWRCTLRRLEQQHTTILLGTTVPIPTTEANRNILLTRGFGPHFAYVQRVPVPIAMWRFGDAAGFPLMLHYPPTIRVLNEHAAVLMCYEQLLVWPALQSLAHDPDMLLAPSNDYWASKTPIPAIQHVAAKSWADLWNIPLYEARNE